MDNIFIDGVMINLIMLYGPNSDSPEFYTKLLQESIGLSAKKVVLGDFNIIQNTTLDRKCLKTMNQSLTKDAEQLINLQEEYMLEETWRVRNPGVKRFSWYRNANTASRIDFALISKGLSEDVHDIFYLNGIKSDHSAICVCIDLVNEERGPRILEI